MVCPARPGWHFGRMRTCAASPQGFLLQGPTSCKAPPLTRPRLIQGPTSYLRGRFSATRALPLIDPCSPGRPIAESLLSFVETLSSVETLPPPRRLPSACFLPQVSFRL